MFFPFPAVATTRLHSLAETFDLAGQTAALSVAEPLSLQVRNVGGVIRYRTPVKVTVIVMASGGVVWQEQNRMSFKLEFIEQWTKDVFLSYNIVNIKALLNKKS